MPTVTVEHAQQHLPDLIDRLRPGEELVITRGDRLAAEPPPARKRRVPGNCRGMMTIVADDAFDPAEAAG